jgi:hypothetical protein
MSLRTSAPTRAAPQLSVPRPCRRAAVPAADRRVRVPRRPPTAGPRTADQMVVPTPPMAAPTEYRVAHLRTAVPLADPTEGRMADRMAPTSSS